MSVHSLTGQCHRRAAVTSDLIKCRRRHGADVHHESGVEILKKKFPPQNASPSWTDLLAALLEIWSSTKSMPYFSASDLSMTAFHPAHRRLFNGQRRRWNNALSCKHGFHQFRGSRQLISAGGCGLSRPAGVSTARYIVYA